MKKSVIAKEVGVHKSTITRELRRNENGQRKYNPNRAYRLAHERHKFKRKYRIDEVTWATLEKLLARE